MLVKVNYTGAVGMKTFTMGKEVEMTDDELKAIGKENYSVVKESKESESKKVDVAPNNKMVSNANTK